MKKAKFKLEPVNERNKTWENNHAVITKAMAAFKREHYKLPTNTQIAKSTGLSRPTVYKHVKYLGQHKLVIAEKTLLRTSTKRVLRGVTVGAMDGDMKALKFWLEMVDLFLRPL